MLNTGALYQMSMFMQIKPKRHRIYPNKEFFAKEGKRAYGLRILGNTRLNTDDKKIQSLGEEKDVSEYKINLIIENQRIANGDDLQKLLAQNMPNMQITIDKGCLYYGGSDNSEGYVIKEGDIIFAPLSTYYFTFDFTGKIDANKGLNPHLRVIYSDGSYDDIYKIDCANEKEKIIFESDNTKTVSGLYHTSCAKNECCIDINSFGIYSKNLLGEYTEGERKAISLEVPISKPLCSLDILGEDVYDICDMKMGRIERNIAYESPIGEAVLLNYAEYPIFSAELAHQMDSESHAFYLEGFDTKDSLEALGASSYSAMPSPCGKYVYFTVENNFDENMAAEYLRLRQPRAIYKTEDVRYEHIAFDEKIFLFEENRPIFKNTLIPKGIEIYY